MVERLAVEILVPIVCSLWALNLKLLLTGLAAATRRCTNTLNITTGAPAPVWLLLKVEEGDVNGGWTKPNSH